MMPSTAATAGPSWKETPVEGSAAPPPEATWTYRDLPIHFPYPPYPSQRLYTEAVMDSILVGANGLLESPTGTGKTLALLCGGVSALRALRRAQPRPPNEKQVILYASRTHSQLAQVVSQLAHVYLGGLHAVVLGSRDQLCLNPVVKAKPTAGEKVALCSTLVKGKRCEFHKNFSQSEAKFEVGKEVCDIEDLVKANRIRKICPYFTSRDLAGKADLVFLPYNYLLDVNIRKTLSVNLRESIVILDEAHNVMKTCEESASVRFETQDVALAQHEVDTVLSLLEKKGEMDVDLEGAGVELSLEDVFLAKEALSKLEDALTAAIEKKELSFEKATPAGVICKILEEGGFGFDRQITLCGILQSVVDLLQLLLSMGGRESGKGINSLLNVVRTVFSCQERESAEMSMDRYFRIFVKRCTKHKNNFIFELWCFHPGFSMQSLSLAGVRSIILTSGTLKPMATFAKELDIPFIIQFTGDHVIGKGQLCVRAFKQGKGNVDMLSTFQNRSNPKYLHSLGQTLVDFAREVPHGMLVFFPSYSVMTHCVTTWQSGGVWSQMTAQKPLFVEPKGKDEFATTIAQFRQTVETATGACLFAVCRGKVAEGIDFADKAARAVVMLGIPFPNLYDAKVKAKKEYMDSRRCADSTQLSGAEWYKLEAFRAINQAIGRVIRHKSDFGAVLFLDKRFSDKPVMSDISDWVSSSAVNATVYEQGVKEVRSFFSTQRSGSALVPTTMPRQMLPPSAGCSSKGPLAKKARVTLNPNRKIVVRSKALNVLNYNASESIEEKKPTTMVVKATNIVVRLKECLAKEEMVLFKKAIKVYKDKNDIEAFFELCKDLLARKKLAKEELNGMKTFLREEDVQKYEQFMEKCD